MMGERTVMQEVLSIGFSIERHVPADHLLRKIDRFVDLSGVRAHRGVAGPSELDPASNRAVSEYLAVLDGAAFGGATPVEPKLISPTDPAARLTAARGGPQSMPTPTTI